MSPVIEVRQLHKRYGETVAVDDISFAVQEGEIFGILGPNGAGKTTTVECIEGLRNPVARQLRVDQANLEDAFLALVGPKAAGSNSREH